MQLFDGLGWLSIIILNHKKRMRGMFILTRYMHVYVDHFQAVSIHYCSQESYNMHACSIMEILIVYMGCRWYIKVQ